jgi:hypothetical protein
MKNLIVMLVFFALPLFAEEVMIEEEQKTVGEELIDISHLMVELEGRLYDDRHDLVLQLQAKEIEERMEKLIKDAEEEEKNEKEGKGTKKKDSKKPGEPKKDSKLEQRQVGEELKVIHRERMPWETREYDDWARLSNIKRDPILQVYNNEMPVLWKKRLMAYFLSINEEENEKTDKQLKLKQAWIKKRLVEMDLDDAKNRAAGRHVKKRDDFPLTVPSEVFEPQKPKQQKFEEQLEELTKETNEKHQ